MADDNNRNHGPADDEDDLENGVGPDEGDELEDDDELEFEDVMQCMTLQDTVDVIADKYGVAE